MSHPSSPTGPDDRGYEQRGYPVPTAYPGPTNHLGPTGDLPPRPPAPGTRVGRVSGVEVRQESQYAAENRSYFLTVLAFRLLEPGNPQPLDVQLRGRSLSGTIREGDWVEVAGPPDATGRWDTSAVQNLTTASTVVVVGGRRSKAATVLVLVVLIVVVLLVVLLGVAFLAALADS